MLDKLSSDTSTIFYKSPSTLKSFAVCLRQSTVDVSHTCCDAKADMHIQALPFILCTHLQLLELSLCCPLPYPDLQGE